MEEASQMDPPGPATEITTAAVTTVAESVEEFSCTDSQASTDVSDSSDELDKGNSGASGSDSAAKSVKTSFKSALGNNVSGSTLSLAESTAETLDSEVEAMDSESTQNPTEEEKENGEETAKDFVDELETNVSVKIASRRMSQDSEGNCYCGRERNLNMMELLCVECRRWHHESCITKIIAKALHFMTNYTFVCKNCSPNGMEDFRRVPVPLAQTCVSALAMLTQQSTKEPPGRKLFSKDEILSHFDMFGETMAAGKKCNWQSKVPRTLTSKEASQWIKVEERPEGTFYGLVSDDLYQISPNYDAMITTGTLKINDANQGVTSRRGAKRRQANETSLMSSGSVAKKARAGDVLPKMPGAHGYPADHPYNKDNFKYLLAEPDPNAPFRQEFDENLAYQNTSIPEWLYRVYMPNAVLLALHDRAMQLKVSEDRLSVTGEKGYCMIRATHGVTRGSWYWEAQITDQPEGSHTRIGFSTMLANLQGPLGYDKYGYSWRSRYGTKFHESKGKSYCKGGYTKGDVLGFLIVMPERAGLAKLPPSCKDKPLVRFKSHLYYEAKDDKKEDRSEDVREGSKLIFFKNGVFQGIAYENVREGSYYPAVSLYKNCTVTVNFGPNFSAEPSQQDYPHKGMYERAEAGIIEQTLSDLCFLTEHDGKLSLENQ